MTDKEIDPKKLDYNKESPEDFKKRFDAIMATFPEDFSDEQLKAHGAVDVTEQAAGSGLIIPMGGSGQ